jgi:hypothetical protein
VNRALQLAHGLDCIGGAYKRMVLLVMAAYASGNGRVCTNERRLRNATELGSHAFTRIAGQLERDGWVRREGTGFTLSISKMEANQRDFMNAADDTAELGNQRFTTINLGTSAPLNR